MELIRTFIYLYHTILKALYSAWVRPHLECVTQIWHSHLKDMEALENVQCHTTTMALHLKDLPYAKQLKKLVLPIMAYRRSRGDLIEASRITTEIQSRRNKEGFQDE